MCDLIDLCFAVARHVNFCAASGTAVRGNCFFPDTSALCSCFHPSMNDRLAFGTCGDRDVAFLNLRYLSWGRELNELFTTTFRGISAEGRKQTQHQRCTARENLRQGFHNSNTFGRKRTHSSPFLA